MRKRISVFFIVVAVLVGLTNSCHWNEKSVVANIEGYDSIAVEVKPDTQVIHLMAVGDLMVHRWQMERAYNKHDSIFDFSCAFAAVKPCFDKADYLVGNLETTFAGRNKGRAKATKGYSCFPFFNAPEAFGEELKQVGFDLLSTINNHSFDSRITGLCSTLHFLDSLKIKSVGTCLTDEPQGRTAVVDVKGVKLGFCAYTTSLNGFRLPDSVAHCVNLVKTLDSVNLAHLRSDIANLRAQETDAIVAIVHFGTEYQRTPNAMQRKMVDSLFAYGVDVVLGSHPHILQRMETRTVMREDSIPHNCVAFYSLGNFISSQRWQPSHKLPKDIGLIVDVEMQKIGRTTQVTHIECKPTYTVWRNSCISVVPVLDVLKDSLSYSKMTVYDKQRLNSAATIVPEILFPKEKNVTYLEDHYDINFAAENSEE